MLQVALKSKTKYYLFVDENNKYYDDQIKIGLNELSKHTTDASELIENFIYVPSKNTKIKSIVIFTVLKYEYGVYPKTIEVDEICNIFNLDIIKKFRIIIDKNLIRN